jgi:multicomponent Na+:H+ antiporter subunit F
MGLDGGLPAALALAGLGVAAVLAVARIVRPGALTDRVVGLDVLLYIVVGSVAVDAARRDDGTYLQLVVVLALLGFLGTMAAAFALERMAGADDETEGP